MTTSVEKVTLLQTETAVVEVIAPSHIVQGGLLPQSSISTAPDVDLTNLTNGAVLVYQENTAKWQATKTLENQVMNGGFF